MELMDVGMTAVRLISVPADQMVLTVSLPADAVL